MKTLTIDTDKNVSAFATRDARGTGSETAGVTIATCRRCACGFYDLGCGLY
jgi:hypothetical protein